MSEFTDYNFLFKCVTFFHCYLQHNIASLVDCVYMYVQHPLQDSRP